MSPVVTASFPEEGMSHEVVRVIGCPHFGIEVNKKFLNRDIAYCCNDC